ncbi:MAG: phosphoribosylformylglycinamidine cyclo-ligase [Chitinophagaceae bacterium]|nr:MAG: phosphoribosylformylglycinamidine cyclo-ligase [Chitinophagaceae bacterium]
MSLYAQRGVSSQKEDVHAATKNLDKGLYPKAFCKIYSDQLEGDDSMVNIMHADGAGTKSILAYLYWKETGDLSVWKGIAQDAIVMNLDDLLCVGVYDKLLFSSTIDRNKNYIPAEILEVLINSSQEFLEKMKTFDIHITYMGGETADVGDVVRTIAVNGTMMARCSKNKLITNEKITLGNVIVGLAGFGKAHYEEKYNSGIASNGLTSARHDLLKKEYATKYPETFEHSLNEKFIYNGEYNLTDKVQWNNNEFEIGHLALSPTRTFAPIIKTVLENHFESIYGLIHCSGGGQTKCLKYLSENVRIIKDNLFEPPLIFNLIQKASNADDREMYQVFNMGTRMEIYTTEKAAADIIKISNEYGVEAQIIGRVEAGKKNELLIKTKNGLLSF